MVKAEELLAAGACLSMKDKVKNESLTDSISARNYRHPALGDRPVIRLTADNLADGEDLTMEFLGFEKADVIGPVAKRQRQALGFPGWAIVNDPKHARYALALVKEFKSAVRRSKAKPGFGYEEFTETSKQLGKSVAHFLPSFWEQAGREFIALDNATYGSRCFSKAREAEKVHALKVNETLRQEAFLEFALAGAVSIKAISEYGKELLTTHDPKAAWKFFRELCVRRTLGGMPPWTSMIKDLQPFMKAAGLDQDEEIQSILVEIVDSPAISRAAMGFWDGASKQVAQLVKKNPHVAGVLLNMIPQTSQWRNDETWPWLKHLDAWGILENAWKDGVPAEAAPAGGPAAWLGRLIRSIDAPRQKLYDILESMAPRLRKDKTPVDLYLKTRWSRHLSADVDLMDMALELKVPFVDVPADISLDLKKWAATSDPVADLRNRPRDPVHLVADPRFTSAMHAALEAAAGESVFENAATGKAALSSARQKWLSTLVDGLTNGGLPRAELSRRLLELKTRQAIFQEFPDVLEQLKKADIQPAILRTLQGGLMDEYGWPALEKAIESFKAANNADPTVFGHFPYVILTDKLKVVVLKEDKIVYEAELKLGKGQELKCLYYIDGDLLVWSSANYQSSWFWNGDPQASDPEYAYFPNPLTGVTVEMPEGGTFFGEKIVHRGDKGLASTRPSDDVVSDGTHWWLRSSDYDVATNKHVFQLHEIDPKTGKKGRKSLPSFFEDFVQEGSELDLPNCSLLPVGDNFANSPLGVRNGLFGTRRRRAANGTTRLEGFDGRACDGTDQNDFALLIDQPGTAERLPVELISEYRRASGFKFWDPSGQYEVAEISAGGDGYSRGQATSVTPLYLHAFQVRDAAASKKLRAITADAVRVLMDAEQQDFVNFTKSDTEKKIEPGAKAPKAKSGLANVTQKLSLRDEAVHSPLLDAAIRKLLGKDVHPRLLTGMRGVLLRAGQTVRQLAKLIEDRAALPSVEKQTLDVNAADAGAAPFLATLKCGWRQGIRSLPHLSFMECVEKAANFFKGAGSSVRFPDDWGPQLRKLSEGVPQVLWATYCEDPKDNKWHSFANSWSQLAYHSLPGSFRIYLSESRDSTLFTAEKLGLTFDGDDDDRVQWLIPYVGKSSRYLIEHDYRGYEVLEYSPTGTFEAIPGLPENKATELVIPRSVWSAEHLRAFVKLAEANPVNYPPVALLNSLADSLKVSVAELALVWFGLPGFHEYAANFMPTHLREACKLKTKECSAAKEALKQISPQLLQSLVRAVVAGDPASLWETPPTAVAERIRAAWQGETQDRLQLSADWVDKLSDALGYGVEKRDFFQALAQPSKHPMLNPEGKWQFHLQRGAAELRCENEDAKFDEDVLEGVLISIGLLAYGMPVGDPVHKNLAELNQSTIKALANPELLISAGYRYESAGPRVQKNRDLVASVVGKWQKQDYLDIADNGALVVACDDHRLHAAFRPARVTKPAQMEHLSNQLQALLAGDGVEGYLLDESVRHVQLLISPEFQEIVTRLKKTPLPAGSYETNPALSVPELVTAVAKKHKLSPEAAAYYLQLLTLADPTDKNVGIWNGWTSATIKKCGTELIGKKLVLEASRSRAGRKFFLPGGWEDLKAPHLPLETWKLPLFRLERDESERPRPPLSRIIPLEPVHSLFAKAWKRITDGDVPKYEEVK